MKRSNKKGFTLVELVIVVAVIAILAGVLIPTIAGVVRRANIAADTAVAKQLNTALATYTAENDKPANFDEVVEVLKAAGFDIVALNAKADGNYYAWDKANNQIVYINEDGKTIYKNKDFAKADLVSVVSSASAVKNAFAAGSSEIVIPTETETVELKGKAPAITISEDTKVNLGNATITVPGDKVGDGVFVAQAGATLTLEGKGVVNGVGDNNYNMALWANGGNIVIKDGTYTNVGATDEGGVNDHFDLIYVKYGGTVTIEGGKFICETPKWTLNSHNTAKGTITIKGGEFFNFNPATDIEAIDADCIKVDPAYKVVAGTPDADGNVWYSVVAK